MDAERCIATVFPTFKHCSADLLFKDDHLAVPLLSCCTAGGADTMTPTELSSRQSCELIQKEESDIFFPTALRRDIPFMGFRNSTKEIFLLLFT